MKKIIIVSYEGTNPSPAEVERIATIVAQFADECETVCISVLNQNELLERLTGPNALMGNLSAKANHDEAARNAAVYIGTLFQKELRDQDMLSFSVNLTRELLSSTQDSKLKKAVRILTNNKIPANIANTYNITKNAVQVIKNVSNIVL